MVRALRGSRRGLVSSLAICLLAQAAFTAGCSAGSADTGAEGESAARSPDGTRPPSASASPTVPRAARSFRPEPDRLPRDRAAALRLARAVALLPEDWGAGFVAQDPPESDPDSWAVLDDDCRWTREPLPQGVLAALSRYSELPVGEGGEAVQVSAVVTVHTTEAGADDRLNAGLEEAMRCSRQELRPGRWIENLNSAEQPPGAESSYAEDSVFEVGVHGEGSGDGATVLPFRWAVDRLGPVTVAVSVRAAASEDAPDPGTLQSWGRIVMGARLVDLLEGGDR
ncbi:hypothetical protein AAH978_08295 [Streptomyces sp. ZYX-F-203]